jgi:Uncharacterised protein family UPF0564.
MQAQKEREAQVKEQSKQNTLANQKPFSFYERDMNKPKVEKQEETFRPFKANPVPEYLNWCY